MKDKPISRINDREALSRIGQRATSQRALLLELINEVEHLDAGDLYRRAKERQPRISLSTVYRTLQLFKRLGLVQERHLDKAHHHYEARARAEHHHLVCLGCGKIIEFDCPLCRQKREDMARANDFEITEVEVRFAGYCASCRKDRG